MARVRYVYVCDLHFVYHLHVQVKMRVTKKAKQQKHVRRYRRQEVQQRSLPLKPADQHTSTHTTHQGSAGRWEEHRGERDGHSLARPLSPHHPASPSQPERVLNQRSKREEGSEGREREERRREGRKRQMQNELMRGSRGSRVLKGSHEMNNVLNACPRLHLVLTSNGIYKKCCIPFNWIILNSGLYEPIRWRF